MTDQPEQTFEPLIQFGLGPEQINAMMKRLSGARVAHRQQGGRELSYVEAWDIRATLIRIFGFGNFSIETIESTLLFQQLRDREPDRNGNPQKPIWDIAFKCVVRLTIHTTGSVYTEAAASMQSNPDYGEAADFAVKTAESDALKRAAVNLGTQFGLGLYDNGSLNEVVRVLIEPRQAAMLNRQEPAVSPEQAAALSQSVGVTSGQETGTETPPAADSDTRDSLDPGLLPDGGVR